MGLLVTGEDSGLGSGVQTAMQQIGAALGLAILIPIAIRHAGHHTGDGTAQAVARTGGYALSFRVGAAVLAAGALAGRQAACGRGGLVRLDRVGVRFGCGPGDFTSSTLVPVATMPGWLRGFAAHQPVTACVDALRTLTLGGPTSRPVFEAVVWIAGLLAVTVPPAVIRYRRTTAA